MIISSEKMVKGKRVPPGPPAVVKIICFLFRIFVILWDIPKGGLP